MRYRECTVDRRENRYIEGEKRQTRMHWAREVHNRASPDHSHKTDGSSGMDLTQKKRED